MRTIKVAIMMTANRRKIITNGTRSTTIVVVVGHFGGQLQIDLLINCNVTSYVN